MTISEIIRNRSSVRHFSDHAVPDHIIQAIIEEASWAPSAGNMQPWRVVVLKDQASARFRKRYEALGWESVLPSLRVAIQSHSKGQQMSSEAINWQTLQVYEQQVEVKGNPTMLAVYYDKTSIKNFYRLSVAAFSLFRYRTRSVKSPFTKLAAFIRMVLRSRRDYRVAQDALKASLANFSYAITLAAKQRGLDSCIQFSYNHAFPYLRKAIGLSPKQRLFCVVLVGKGEDATKIEGVQSRTRKPVQTNHIDSI